MVNAPPGISRGVHKFLDMEHTPVLLHEVIAMLNPCYGEFFIDGTLGGGGHARAIIERLGNSGMFLGVDKDRRAISQFREQMENNPNGTLPNSSIFIEQSNYAHVSEIMKKNNMPKADGLIVDLGFSSYQINDPTRGFSFHIDGPLDMRYEDLGDVETARDVINNSREEEIVRILKVYGEERFPKRIANAIVLARKKKKIETTIELARVIVEAVPTRFRHGRIHLATRTFQAFRIFVNHELENLETLLTYLPDIVNSGGRVAIISFHSLEDRMVKTSFRDFAKSGICQILTKKPIVPEREEVEHNPRSRSAKLRVIKFI